MRINSTKLAEKRFRARYSAVLVGSWRIDVLLDKKQMHSFMLNQPDQLDLMLVDMLDNGDFDEILGSKTVPVREQNSSRNKGSKTVPVREQNSSLGKKVGNFGNLECVKQGLIIDVISTRKGTETIKIEFNSNSAVYRISKTYKGWESEEVIKGLEKRFDMFATKTKKENVIKLANRFYAIQKTKIEDAENRITNERSKTVPSCGVNPKIKAGKEAQAILNVLYADGAIPTQTTTNGKEIPVVYLSHKGSWHGKGKKPQWLKDYTANGGNLADIKIEISD